MTFSLRFLVVAVLMGATAVLLKARGDVDRVPPSRPLSELPKSIGSRSATDIPIEPGVLELLGGGTFLNRVYTVQNTGPALGTNDRASIGLFIGYFPTQRSGQSIHSPQNCLPGAGWVFQSSGVTDLTDPAGKRYTVGEYLISNGISTQEVLYWYRVHGRSIASDFKAKAYTLADSIRYDRTDAALIRVITPLEPGEDRMQAHLRAVSFADQIVPLLPAYIPD
jgi:EpsI family protein